MKQQITLLILLGSLAFVAAPQANASGYDQNRYDATGRYRAELLRDTKMPRWLRRDKGFRHWYRRSSLQRNYFLAWPQLLEIYRWERRYSQHHRSQHEYYDYGYRDYDRYRRKWRKHDNKHRRRRNKTNRHRRDDYYRYH